MVLWFGRHEKRCQALYTFSISVKKSFLVEKKSTLNNNTCTLCLCRNSQTSSHPKLLDINKTSLRTAALMRFYFGCLFVNMYKDLHFHFLNVLKATVTGVLSLVSITFCALLSFFPLSSSPLRRNKQWLAGIWSPGSVMEWMAGNSGYKTNAAEENNNRQGTHRECDDWQFFHC